MLFYTYPYFLNKTVEYADNRVLKMIKDNKHTSCIHDWRQTLQGNPTLN